MGCDIEYTEVENCQKPDSALYSLR